MLQLNKNCWIIICRAVTRLTLLASICVYFMVFLKQPDVSIFLGYGWFSTQVTNARSRILGDLEGRVILYNRSKSKLMEKKKKEREKRRKRIHRSRDFFREDSPQ